MNLELIVAECLRLGEVIVQAWRALVGSQCMCVYTVCTCYAYISMYVCMYVMHIHVCMWKYVHVHLQQVYS